MNVSIFERLSSATKERLHEAVVEGALVPLPLLAAVAEYAYPLQDGEEPIPEGSEP